MDVNAMSKDVKYIEMSVQALKEAIEQGDNVGIEKWSRNIVNYGNVIRSMARADAEGIMQNAEVESR